jgi:hypothetical protein
VLHQAFDRLHARTLADLGGIWAVDGGYSLYAVDQLGAEGVTIVDENFTERSRAEADRRPGSVRLVEGNFGDSSLPPRVGQVDLVVCFDVLLHQVSPDWDEVVAMWAPVTNRFAFAGPWWNGPETIRLLELGAQEYVDAVPEKEFHRAALEKLDEINPDRGRPWRDVHDIWQWGITEDSLRRTMSDLGFVCAYSENRGIWRGLEHFDDCGYIFCRREVLAS